MTCETWTPYAIGREKSQKSVKLHSEWLQKNSRRALSMGDASRQRKKGVAEDFTIEFGSPVLF